MRREITGGPAPRAPEPLHTFREAAELFGIPYWKIQRAAKLGLIPTYKLLNARCYVRRSDIERLLAPPAAPVKDAEQGSFEFTGSEGGSR